MGIDPKKLERLKKITAAVNKTVKDAGVTFLGGGERITLKRFTSGIPGLNDALGGGWPIGRLVELYGGESTGKTTLCYHAIAEFQKLFPDEIVAWIDSEHSFEQDYADRVGVKSDEMIFQQPETGEDALEVIKQLILGGVKLIVVDSVAALTPRAEREKQFGDRTMGETARLMSTALKQLAGDASKNDAIIFFTNQTREKIGVMYGDKTTTPGGKALKFYASIRLELRNMGIEKDGDIPVNIKIKALCKKNKTFPPMRTADYTITFGVGVDAVVDVFDSAVKWGVIEKSGAWYAFNGSRLGQGKAASLDCVRNNSTLLEEIKTKYLEVKATGKPLVPVVKGVKKPKIEPLTPSEEEPNENDFSSEGGVELNEGDNVEVMTV